MNASIRRLTVSVIICAVAAGVVVGAVASYGVRNPDVDSRSATQGLPNLKTELIAKQWVLDVGSSRPAVDHDGAVTLRFHPDGSIEGRGPCNAFTGTVDFGADTVDVSEIAMTAMGCEPDVMAAEASFHDAFASIDGVKITPNHEKLTLIGPDDTRLVFHGRNPSQDEH